MVALTLVSPLAAAGLGAPCQVHRWLQGRSTEPSILFFSLLSDILETMESKVQCENGSREQV